MPAGKGYKIRKGMKAEGNQIGERSAQNSMDSMDRLRTGKKTADAHNIGKLRPGTVRILLGDFKGNNAGYYKKTGKKPK